MEIGTFFPAGTATRLSIANIVRSRLALAAVAVGVIALATAWQWSWLVAIGVAPLLLSVAPCAAMCALGLCMPRICGGSSASATSGTQGDPGRIESSSCDAKEGDLT